MRLRVRFGCGIAMAAMGLLCLCATASAQSTLDPLFNPGANSRVTAVAVQPDGKILIGGNFTTLGGGGAGTTARRRIGRVNADGSIDASFDPGANGEVHVFLVQSDGKILVGGSFTTLGGGGSGTTTRNRIGRLNADGSIDTGFDPGTDSGTGYEVNALALQSDGKILVGGRFGGLGGGSGSTPRRNIGRLNTDGSVDATFNPGTDSAGNGVVRNVILQPDGKIVVSGFFSGLGGGTGSTPRGGIGRLNPDGSVDSFDTNAARDYGCIALLPDGKILAYDAVGRVWRINTDGSNDPGLYIITFAPVSAMAVLPDGKVLLGGSFSKVSDEVHGWTSFNDNLARLKADGSVDLDFSAGVGGAVLAIAVQGDRKVLIGGEFIQAGGTERRQVARFLAPTFTLSIVKAGSGSGVVTTAPAGISCGATCSSAFDSGQAVSLTSTASADSSFVGWSGDADCADGTVTMSATISCTATFALQLPGAFNKTAPANATTDQPTSLTLSWQGSVGAASYQYCVDLTNDNACDGGTFTAVGSATSIAINVAGGSVYYWQVRAVNAAGTTQADAGVWFRFTVPVPAPSGLTATAGLMSGRWRISLTWTGVGAAESYTIKRGSSPGNEATIASGNTSGTYVDASPAAGVTYFYVVTAVNSSGESARSNEVSATTALFTDEPLLAGETPIKLIHITELRTLIDTLRGRYGLAPFGWAELTLSPGVSQVRAAHISELRAALEAAYVAAGFVPPTYSDPALTSGSSAIRALHIVEIRNAVLAIY